MTIIRNVVFSGGGVNGACHVGSVIQLERELGHTLKPILRVAGSSTGAIMALMVALNCSAEEIKSLYLQIDFTKIPDTTCFIHEASNMYQKGSVHNGSELRRAISELLLKKNIDLKITFAELIKQGYKDLHVVTTVVGERHGEGTTDIKQFCAEETPDTEILPTVIASASIQGLFPPIYLKEIKAGQFVEIDDPTNDSENVLMYNDGGFMLNHPIQIFDNAKYLSGNTESKSEGIFNHETIGFMICTPKELLPEDKMQLIKPKLQYAGALLRGAIFSKQNNDFRRGKDRERTVMVSNHDIPSVKFNISLAEKVMLIQSGIHATELFFHPARHIAHPTITTAFSQHHRQMPSPVNSSKYEVKAKETEDTEERLHICAIL